MIGTWKISKKKYWNMGVFILQKHIGTRHGVPLYKRTVCSTGYVKMEPRDCENGVQGFISNTPYTCIYIVIVQGNQYLVYVLFSILYYDITI